jgi:hypothetical protein
MGGGGGGERETHIQPPHYVFMSCTSHKECIQSLIYYSVTILLNWFYMEFGLMHGGRSTLQLG